jgi:hypothetical protein
MKKKIGELISWTIGYDISKVSRVRLTPTINFVKANPRKLPPDGRTVLEIEASVDDPGGLINISGVRADLSSIGRLPNAMLVDNGLFGDAKANDGIYTLQTSVSSRINPGAKDIQVAVANKKGWLALARTSVDVSKNPIIVDIRMNPDHILADGQSMATLTVKVDNPGRIEDISSVTADLRSFGLAQNTPLRNDGQAGDTTAGDDTWTIRFTVSESVAAGTYEIPIFVTNVIGGATLGHCSLTVSK